MLAGCAWLHVILIAMPAYLSIHAPLPGTHRPEKDHALQLRALAAARTKAAGMHDGAGDAVLSAHLKLVGSCRNAEDEARIEQLKGGWASGGGVERVGGMAKQCHRPAADGGNAVRVSVSCSALTPSIHSPSSVCSAGRRAGHC